MRPLLFFLFILLTTSCKDHKANHTKQLINVTEPFVDTKEVEEKMKSQISKALTSDAHEKPLFSINTLFERASITDSILIVTSSGSSFYPCKINFISTFNLNAVLKDVYTIPTDCDCPSDCEGCGWNELKHISDTSFQVTRVEETVSPKFDPQGIPLEYDCQVTRTFNYETYHIDTNGKISLTESHKTIKEDSANSF